MPGEAVHTVHRNGQWFNVLEGHTETLGEGFEWQEDAVAAGEHEARERKVDHMIHGLDGQVHQRNHYEERDRHVHH